MKCFVLGENESFSFQNTKKEEISAELEKIVNELCANWQVRNLSQKGSSNYGDDGIVSQSLYEALNPESFVMQNGKVVGYFADHFGESGYLLFEPKDNKIKLGSYDYSDYHSGTGKVDRGHLDIVPRPDLDTNPYYDEPRFHSQAEYDDYIKWRD